MRRASEHHVPRCDGTGKHVDVQLEMVHSIPGLEHAVLLTGIGGQGVQLAARTLAVAAVKSELEVMVFGDYGGLMRGGNTDATIVIGDDASDSEISPGSVGRS